MDPGKFLKFNEDESLTSKILISLGILVFVSALFLFFNDSLLKSFLQTGSFGSPIATVENSDNDIRRRSDKSVSWFSLDKGEEIFENDVVFSGKNSTAKLKFRNGSSVTVAENSLVVVKEENGKTNLSLKYGKFKSKISLGETLRVEMGGKVQEISPAEDTEIEILESPLGTQLKVISGQLRVANKIIAANQKLSVDENGKISDIKPINLELVSPAHKEKFWLKADDEIGFLWTSYEQQESYKVTVATDSYFQDEVFSTYVRDQTSLSTKELEPGRYFWKVETTDGRHATSETAEFKVYPEVLPQLVYPPDGTEFEISSADNADADESFEATLVFEDRSKGERFLVEVSNSIEFNSPLVSDIVESHRLEQLRLPVGDYYWRVKVVDAHRVNAQWSETSRFNIRSQKQSLPTPTLLSQSDFEYVIPPQSEKVRAIKSDSELEAFLRNDMKRPIIAFQPVLGAEKYEVQLDNDYRFLADKRKRFSTNMSRFGLFPVKPGKHFYRMRALSLDRPASEFSNIVSVQVKVSPPKLKTNELQKTVKITEKPEIELKWTPRIFAKYYKVQVSDSDRFSKPREFIASSTRIKASVMPSKNYYYRVLALDRQKKEISNYSKIGVAQLVIEKAPEIRRLASKPKKKEKKKEEQPKETLRSPASLTVPIKAKFANWPWWQVELGSFAGLATFSTNVAGFSLNNSDLNQNKSIYLHSYFAVKPNFLVNGYYETISGQVADVSDGSFKSQWVGLGGRYRYWGNLKHGLAAYVGAGYEQAEYFRFSFESDINPDVVNRPISLGAAYFSTGLEWRSYYQLRGHVNLSYYHGLSSASRSPDTSVFNITKSSQVAIDTSVSHTFTENSYLGIGLRYRLVNYSFTSNEFGTDNTGEASNSQVLFRVFVGAEH